MFGFPADVHMEMFTGLAATNNMAVGGIKSGDNLLAVISIGDSNGFCIGRDKTDFTVGNGTLNAATIDLSNTKCWAIWTSSPAS